MSRSMILFLASQGGADEPFRTPCGARRGRGMVRQCFAGLVLPMRRCIDAAASKEVEK